MHLVNLYRDIDIDIERDREKHRHRSIDNTSNPMSMHTPYIIKQNRSMDTTHTSSLDIEITMHSRQRLSTHDPR